MKLFKDKSSCIPQDISVWAHRQCCVSVCLILFFLHRSGAQVNVCLICCSFLLIKPVSCLTSSFWSIISHLFHCSCINYQHVLHHAILWMWKLLKISEDNMKLTFTAKHKCPLIEYEASVHITVYTTIQKFGDFLLFLK